MAHSTTATSTYPLTKYSKSYPNALQNTSESTPEWQHFTNPPIRLVLDVRKGAQLESVRLRILWSMDSGNDPAQREVVFEDIDLLTFSSLPHPSAPKQQAQGLPLKAVYRDTVVGIRYLHPIEYKDVPAYRRFQITFYSTVAVSEFIKTISSVCPCKANPAPNPAPRTMNLPPAPRQHQALSHHPSVVFQATRPLPTMLSKRVTGLQTSLTSSPNIPFPQSSITSITLSPPPEVNQTQLPPSDPLLSTGQLTTGSTPPESSFRSTQAPSNSRNHDLQQQTSLSDSSLPNSSAQNSNFNTSGVPGDSDAQKEPSALLASIRQSTRLYDLPRTQLEQLVGEVIREEGFVELMENLNSMWAVKKYVGI